MELIYKIYGVMLYDNQLDHDYIILYNRSKSFTGSIKRDLPYEFSGSSDYGALNKIYNMNNDDKNKLSIDVMREASEKSNLPFIKNDGFITLVKTKVSHSPNYNGYHIYWNETKSGINIHDYEVCGIWNKGQSQYSSYRIWEYKNERSLQLRDYNLNLLLK